MYVPIVLEVMSLLFREQQRYSFHMSNQKNSLNMQDILLVLGVGYVILLVVLSVRK